MKARFRSAFWVMALVGGFTGYEERPATPGRLHLSAASAAEISEQNPDYRGPPTERTRIEKNNRREAVAVATVAPENPPVPAESWGQKIDNKAEFYAASDVSAFQVKLTRKWYEIAAHAWGNYGPLEFWVVGSSKKAASQLDQKYCQIRKQKNPAMHVRDCLRRGHNFASYAINGSAGLNTRRNENEQWSGFIITMSGKYPGPEEEDYMPVVLHEYFHVYQHAHVQSRKKSEREKRNRKNPWWSEGGAEYMAQLLYSRQEGVRTGYLRQKMQRKLKSLKDLRSGESIRDIPYGKRGIIGYDLGAWFIAFLIHKTSEEAYRVRFFQDLNREGFEGAFRKSFGRSSNQFLDEFHNTFLKLSRTEKLRILP